MSVKVDLKQLADAMADFAFAYLITVGDDFRAHTIAVRPVLVDGVLDVGPTGATTSRNVAQHPDVTLVWPPSEPGGYSLIVDGRSTPPGGDGALVVIPGSAVLHRRAHDCVPIEAD